MNLPITKTYIILILLSLASLETAEDEKVVVNQFSKDENGASFVSPAKTSANTEVQRPNASKETSPARDKAHGPLSTFKRDSSALHVFNNTNNEENSSAVGMLPDKTENQTRLKYLRGWARKRKRRKKRGTLSVGKKDDGKMVVNKPSHFVTDGEYVDEEDENDEDNEDVNLEELDSAETEEGNSTELGRYLGSQCETSCSEKLLHVFCDPNSRICECEKKYPVQIGIRRGCAKPKQLGDQCFYAQTCSFSDPNAVCMQINHNAICQCKPGFHSVALRRGAKRSFCSEDQVVVSTDLPTLLGVATGIAVLTGLICFVLKLFNNNRYPNRGYNNANVLQPPLLFPSDNQWINGIPLTVHGRPSSRTSSQRSTTNLAQYPRCKGVPVPASRAGAARAAAILLIPCHLQASKPSNTEVASRSRNDDSDAQENEKEHFSRPGSRRPSISSIKSTTSSQRSMTYSARRFEQENQQKEQRAAMRAAREEAARLAAPPTPSPLSTDELLPACSKMEEDEPLGLASSMKSPTPKNGSFSELSSKLSPIMPAAPRL